MAGGFPEDRTTSAAFDKVMEVSANQLFIGGDVKIVASKFGYRGGQGKAPGFRSELDQIARLLTVLTVEPLPVANPILPDRQSMSFTQWTQSNSRKYLRANR